MALIIDKPIPGTTMTAKDSYWEVECIHFERRKKSGWFNVLGWISKEDADNWAAGGPLVNNIGNLLYTVEGQLFLDFSARCEAENIPADHLHEFCQAFAVASMQNGTPAVQDKDGNYIAPAKSFFDGAKEEV